MKKNHFIVVAMCFFALTASAQLKVASTGKVSVGTTSNSLSALSVNSPGNNNYAAYINGNMKVTNGYLYAGLYNYLKPLAGNPGNFDNPLRCLMSLTPVIIQPPQSNPSDLGEGDETDDLTPNTPLDPIVVPQVHYAFSAPSMTTYFPLLAETDELGYYVGNYTELIPVMVKALQVMANEINDLQDALGAKTSLSDDSGEEQKSEDMQPQSRSRLSEKLSGAVLYQNTPNPFREKTVIRFRLPEEAQDAYVYIFDMTGKTLKQLPVDSSMQSVTIGGYELSAGMYIYSLIVNGQEVDTKRMILSK